LNIAASTIACLGANERLPIAVAIVLAASLYPFENPKAMAKMTMRARAIRCISKDISGMLEGYSIKDIDHVPTLVGRALH
jgi:hypothetical protein